MKFDILTLFPDVVHTYASESILGRAQQKKLITVQTHNFREFTLDKQHHVDERPYGGGPGMILQVEPIYRCLESLGLVKDGRKSKVKSLKSKVIIMDPAGKKFDQRMAEKFSKLDSLVLVSGRYEGFDERVYKFIDEKISVGDYVLAGGELPSLTIVEATARLIPGVLGNSESLKEETHGKYPTLYPSPIRGGARGGVVAEYPQYTRPENFMGLKVPKLLTEGNHKKIAEWQKKKSK
jgi:tRNA (guanine37-N1)-methyltransferase